jgi:hypothetical protein
MAIKPMAINWSERWQSIGQKAVAARKLLGAGVNLIRKVDRFLVDEQFFEGEGHCNSQKKRKESGESRPDESG